MKKICYFVCCVVLVACSSGNEKQVKPHFFDLKAYIEKQIVVFEAQKPMLTKKVEIEGIQEQNQSNKIEWAKELDLFIQADLNKTAYANSYRAMQEANTLWYQLKTNENLPVQFLKITFEAGTSEPRHIEALFHNENYLFRSEKHISLTADAQGLKAYRIDGFQQLIFGEKKPFLIEAMLR